MDPADLQRNQTPRKTKKINSLFVIFVSVTLNLALTAYLVMQYNTFLAEVKQVQILEQANLKLQLIILQLQGFKIEPQKPKEKPNSI